MATEPDQSPTPLSATLFCFTDVKTLTVDGVEIVYAGLDTLIKSSPLTANKTKWTGRACSG